jgi:hypothetical protein
VELAFELLFVPQVIDEFADSRAHRVEGERYFPQIGAFGNLVGGATEIALGNRMGVADETLERESDASGEKVREEDESRADEGNAPDGTVSQAVLARHGRLVLDTAPIELDAEKALEVFIDVPVNPLGVGESEDE